MAIEVHDVTVAYGRRPVLWDVDVSIPAGRLVAIVGPNGAGKSTLLKAVLGLVPLASGSIEVFGRAIRDARRLVGYVPQREAVDWDFPIDALDVVLMGRYGRLGWFSRPKAEDREAARRRWRAWGLRGTKSGRSRSSRAGSSSGSFWRGPWRRTPRCI